MDDEGVVIVGGGPAGLATAIGLRRSGLDRVLVIEREREAGGVPRHCAHTGFGARDLRRICSGPAYAQRYRELAERAGVEVTSETMVTGWAGERRLQVTGPVGRRVLAPRAIVLASGCRERPRSARLVPGSRPDGVMTTGTLQQHVHLKHRDVGRRAVVVGAEHVSFSAIATLAEAGASVVALVTEQPHHQSLLAFRAGAALRYRTPVWTRAAVTRIDGGHRVEAVEITDLQSGRRREVPCDLVIFSGDWIPDVELATLADCHLDPGTKGPRTDTALRTSVPGLFAAGNVLHPAETADVCALGGAHAARSVAGYMLGDRAWPAQIELAVRPPLRWISPNAVSPAAASPPRDRFLIRSEAFVHLPQVAIAQDGRRLWEQRLWRLVPTRSAHISAAWISKVDPGAGPVTVQLTSGRRGA